MFRLVKHSFQIYDQNSWQMTSSKSLWCHHFDLSNFLFGTKNLTLIYYSSHQNVIIFKNFGNAFINNAVINFKANFLYVHLETNYYSKLGTFTTFGLAVG